MRRLVSAVVTSAVAAGTALSPLVALAEGPAGGAVQGRAVAAPHDMPMIIGVTAVSLIALIATAGVGYLYRRERHLDWPFQAADVAHDEHH